jgi:hypothetical protein
VSTVAATAGIALKAAAVNVATLKNLLILFIVMTLQNNILRFAWRNLWAAKVHYCTITNKVLQA